MKKKIFFIVMILILLVFIFFNYFRNLFLLKKFTTFSLDNYSKYYFGVRRFDNGELYNSNNMYKYNNYSRFSIGETDIYCNDYENTMIKVEKNKKQIVDKTTLPTIQTLADYVNLSSDSFLKKYLMPLTTIIIPIKYNNQSAYKITFLDIPITTWYVNTENYAPIACTFNNCNFQYTFYENILENDVIYKEEATH